MLTVTKIEKVVDDLKHNNNLLEDILKGLNNYLEVFFWGCHDFNSKFARTLIFFDISNENIVNVTCDQNYLINSLLLELR